jgi:hypothetical protein
LKRSGLKNLTMPHHVYNEAIKAGNKTNIKIAKKKISRRFPTVQH